MFEDVETIDETTALLYNGQSSQICWSTLIDFEYFGNQSSKSIMDFARRWGKTMQYLMRKGTPFSETVIPAAKAANLDSIGPLQKFRALELLVAVWQYDDQLFAWSEDTENLYDFLTI